MFSFNANKTQSGLSTSTSQPNFFGQPAAGTQQPTAAGTAAGGGLFSFNKPADQTANTSSTGLFGAATAQQPNATLSTGSLFSFANKPATNTLTPSLSTSSSFGSGLLNKPATLGATTTTASPFGQTGAGTTGGGIFGGFGKPGTTNTGQTTAPSIFGAAPNTSANTSFTGFGSGATTTQTAQPSQTGLFGGSTQPATGSSLFSFGGAQRPANTSGIFGGLLGQPAAGSSILGGGGGVPVATSQPVQPQPQEQDILLNSLVNPQVFNDERDTILAKWNQLQAFSGFGKIFYQNSAVDVSRENLLNRFKTIGYSCRPTNKNEDGLVGLILNKKEADVRADQKTIVAALHKIFNSDAALSVVIESIKPASDDKCEIVFYVNQRVSQLTDQTNRIASSMVYQHLSKQEAPTGLLSGLNTKPTTKQQLDAMGVQSVYPVVGMSDDEVRTYLENVPSGMNPVLWEQAKKNNPNGKKLMPVQIVGFQEINKRFKLQEEENKSQRTSLAVISNSIDNLNDRNKILRSKIDQFKARNDDLEQRTLKVMINYEIRRKLGLPLQDNEKYLYALLESIQMELSSPINKEIQRQKLSEFNDIVKSLETRKRQLQQQQQQQQQKQSLAAQAMPLAALNADTSGSFDPSSLGDIQRSLREQQKAFKSLIDMIDKDGKDLELMRKMLNEK